MRSPPPPAAAAATSVASPTALPARLRMAAMLAPIAAALLAYASSLGGGFVFDDEPSFVNSQALARGDWWGLAFGPTHTPLANRPFTCFTFAVNPALGGSLATGYRVGNLLLHVLNVLLVLSVVRRCLQSPNLAGRFTPTRATWIAIAVATLWACHPLGTDAVAYVTQRTTLLMSCSLLATLHFVLRHAETPQRRWRVLAVAAMALGMASKEELVAAPLLVVLFERAFLLPDWRSLRARVPFYGALAATWLVLATCVALGPSNDTVGYDALQKVSAIEWLMTQSGVLLHYLRLCVWPHPLCAVYDWGIVRDVGAAWLPLLAVTALFVGSLWQWRRRPWLGWLGAMFFLLLGPTSSVMPIVTEVAAERRMYLPMLAVLVPVVLLTARLVVRERVVVGAALAVAAVVPAILATRAHAATFQDPAVFWTAVAARNQLTNGSVTAAIALQSYAHVMREQGRLQEGCELLERAMRCEVVMPAVRLNYAGVLGQLGRLDECEKVLRALVLDHPNFGTAIAQLATALLSQHDAALVRGQATSSDPRLREAMELIARAQRLRPDPTHLNVLGLILLRQGRAAEAEALLSRVVREHPQFSEAKANLAITLGASGRLTEAIALWRQVLAARPADVSLRVVAARTLLQAGDRAAAAEMIGEVLRAEPQHAEGLRLLQEIEAKGR